MRYDPIMIAGFILAHVCMLAVIVGFVMPKWYDGFVPLERRQEGREETVVGVVKEEMEGDGERAVDVERGRFRGGRRKRGLRMWCRNEVNG